MSASRSANALLAVVFLPLLSVSDAIAYVPTVTEKSHVRASWQGTNCVTFRVDSGGAHDVSLPKTMDAIRRAAENWNKAISSCSYMNVLIGDIGSNLKKAVNKQSSNENVIVWVESDWQGDPRAVAITSIEIFDDPASEYDGFIVDTDIELNGAYTFSALGEANQTDIESTLTHEFGHALGLNHPCDNGSDSNDIKDTKDHMGNPIPACMPISTLSNAIRESTMFVEQWPGETKKRSVEADDILGVCQTYPKANDPDICRSVDLTDLGGCSTPAAKVHRADGELTTLMVIAILMYLARKRKRPFAS